MRHETCHEDVNKIEEKKNNKIGHQPEDSLMTKILDISLRKRKNRSWGGFGSAQNESEK